MSSNKLLILGAGVMQIPIIQKSVEMGYETIVVDYDPGAPGISYADRSFLNSTLDKHAVLRIAKEESVNGILTTSDAPVTVVAEVSQILGLPSMSIEAAEICTNKYLQRRLFQKYGINCPKFYLADSESDLNDYSSFPYIVKPIDSSASRGVKKVNTAKEMKEAVLEALSYSRSGKVIIESFIEGREFSVETLTQKGITRIVAITEKVTKGEQYGYFVEDTHKQPANLSSEEKSQIASEVIKAISAIGLDNSPSHTEIKINERGAFIIEIACRLGGDYITSDLVPLSTGVDMLGNLVRISTGEEIKTEKSISKYSAVQFLNPENYESCNKFIEYGNKCIMKYDVLPYKPNAIRNSMDRLGYIIIQTDSKEDLEGALLLMNNQQVRETATLI